MARKYLHDKPPAGISSYQKYLRRGVETAMLQGAKLEIKEYTLRIPPAMTSAYEITGKKMRDDGDMLVTIWSGRKIIAHLMLEKSLYLGTCKDRNDYDYMIESVECNFLRPLDSALNPDGG